MNRKFALSLLLVAGLGSLAAVLAEKESGDPASRRARADKLYKDGNFQEAYDLYAALAADPADSPDADSRDLTRAVDCLHRINRVRETDALIEKVVAAHADEWRLLATAAERYFDESYHYGFLVAGEFERGSHRGGGHVVNSFDRDRARALQLMQQAMPKLPSGKDGAETGRFYVQLSEILLGRRGYAGAWRLQELTDLKKLPDYEEGYGWGYRYYGAGRGAPVKADGTPVYYTVPKSWAAAENDGQRWRWSLALAAERDPNLADSVAMNLADFCRSQFGVQTMRQYGWIWSRPESGDETRKDESGIFDLSSLGEDETIARLATGIRRFHLPDEFNFVRIYRGLAGNGGRFAESALDKLASLFEDRRQYDTAAETWRRAIREHGAGSHNWRKARLSQIVDDWGRFEPVRTQAAGRGATVDFRYRNGTQVSFSAYAVDVRKLLDDLKDYLEKSSGRLDWNHLNLSRIGYRLVTQKQTQYVAEKPTATWDLDLKPRPHHFDRRTTVTTPLQKAGAYLLVGKMKDGNTSRIVLWVADTAIVAKRMSGKAYCYVADADTGAPIPKANVEFFGYRQEWQGKRNAKPVVYTRDFAEIADADGQVVRPTTEDDRRYQWIAIATTPGGRLAYLGWQRIWYSGSTDAEYDAVKAFLITDRPVYRPGRTVKFKFWINHSRYDEEGKSAFAGMTFVVRASNPRGEKVMEKHLVADEYGGIQGELALPKGATLGVWRLFVPGKGGGSFRVEEYKKPEYEVTVESPEKPVALGEKVSAKIKARYYFGAPVVGAKVHYTVMRTPDSGRWYPPMPWDWFYGPGYWWFGYDYPWYPGWKYWGCSRPVFSWWGWRPQPQPELVAEADAKTGADGTVPVEIDTTLAKAIHGDTDHEYRITAEVTDESRRTVVGTGTVLAARKPFSVYAWVDRGHYRAGDTVRASFRAQTPYGKPVANAKGALTLYSVSYEKGKPQETAVQSWDLPTNAEGQSVQQMKAAKAGQYRLSYKVTDSAGRTEEGGYVFVVTGEGFDHGADFRFDDLELVPDRKQYAPGDTVRLMINTNRVGSTVLLFLRPANGVYGAPEVLHLDGKSTVQSIEVKKRDMPNFFVEAMTVGGGRVYQEVREIVVPPESRVLKVDVEPSAKTLKPGAKAGLRLELTDSNGKPFVGSAVVSVYDKAVEAISGGSNVPDIKAFFWKWRRHHYPSRATSLDLSSANLLERGEVGMGNVGTFGDVVATGGDGAKGQSELRDRGADAGALGGSYDGFRGPSGGAGRGPRAPAEKSESLSAESRLSFGQGGGAGAARGVEPLVQPTVRKNFADTAFWAAEVTTNAKGEASVEWTMPESLTTWKTRVWAMGAGARCGEGSAEMVTTKKLIVRLQAPRFFVQKDEVVLSANVHNYLETEKKVTVSLDIAGPEWKLLDPDPEQGLTQVVSVAPQGERRVDWRIQLLAPGMLRIAAKALTDEESDAMEMRFPVHVHGMLKTESFSGVIRPEGKEGSITLSVPAERRPEESRLEIRYSPTLAGAMVDALPYLVDYPYGCTEQTLDRFLPTVITQRVLLSMGLDLAAIQKKRTNLNAQETGDDEKRAKDWGYRGGSMSRGTATLKNPVFDAATVKDMAAAGVERLASMQCSDGGWGWFSGWGERSWPHTTALVVHGLQIAKSCDVGIVPGVLEKGVAWLKAYQAEQLRRLKLPETDREHKSHGDNLDAFVYMVLVDAGADQKEMRDLLYRDRNYLAVYAKAMFGLACNTVGDTEKRDMLLRNIEQFLVQDEEDQTAYLRLSPNTWWFWYGSEFEAEAYYLELLCATDPKGKTASRLVKYLINNRKNATYWTNTRDTGVVIEALADYLKASGETKPDMTLTVSLDGKPLKQVRIDAGNLFSFDNKVVLTGDAVTTGKHTITLARTGSGPVYYNAYLTDFTLEDPIGKAGLEIRVSRKYYKLVRAKKTQSVEGTRGQAVSENVEKYDRVPLAPGDVLKSGDLVEVELVVESKNDYEYIVLEDQKPAGFEPVEVRSGYNGNEMGAYVEYHDDRVALFVRRLARGTHSVTYRVRAEIPGKFSALPAKASAMYAPELKANSDEAKVAIRD